MLRLQGKLAFAVLALMLVIGVSGSPPWEQMAVDRNDTMESDSLVSDGDDGNGRSQGNGFRGKPETHPGRKGFLGLLAGGGNDTLETDSLSSNGGGGGGGKGRWKVKGKPNKFGEMGLGDSADSTGDEPLSCYECADLRDVRKLSSCNKIVAKRGFQCYTEMKIVNGKASLTLGMKNGRVCSKQSGDPAVWAGTLTDFDANGNATLCKRCCNTNDCNYGDCLGAAAKPTTVAPMTLEPFTARPNKPSGGQGPFGRITRRPTATTAQPATQKPNSKSVTPEPSQDLEICLGLVENFSCNAKFVQENCPILCGV